MMTRWTRQATVIIIPSSRHISVFAFTSPMFGLCGRAIVGDRPSFDSLLETWPNIASCSVFTKAAIFHSRSEKEKGPLSTSVKAIKGVSLFLATGDYLAYRRVSCSGSPPSSFSFSSSPTTAAASGGEQLLSLCLFCPRSETRHQKTRNWLNARATDVR